MGGFQAKKTMGEKLWDATVAGPWKPAGAQRANGRDKEVEKGQRGHKKPDPPGPCGHRWDFGVHPTAKGKSLQVSEQRSSAMRWQPARGATEAGGSVAKFIHGTVSEGIGAPQWGPPCVSAHDLAAGFLQHGRETDRKTNRCRRTDTRLSLPPYSVPWEQITKSSPRSTGRA